MTEYRAEDYYNYRLKRAKETILEVEVLIQNEFWNTAINRMYYACFYAVGALLVSHGIETSSHSGTRQKFGQLFVKTGKIDKELGRHYSKIFEKRQKSDYTDFFEYDEEIVLNFFPISQKFIAQIELLIRKEENNNK